MGANPGGSHQEGSPSASVEFLQDSACPKFHAPTKAAGANRTATVRSALSSRAGSGGRRPPPPRCLHWRSPGPRPARRRTGETVLVEDMRDFDLASVSPDGKYWALGRRGQRNTVKRNQPRPDLMSPLLVEGDTAGFPESGPGLTPRATAGPLSGALPIHRISRKVLSVTAG